MSADFVEQRRAALHAFYCVLPLPENQAVFDAAETALHLQLHRVTARRERVRRVLIPLPDRDFDVTEVAVPWSLLREHHIQVVFATEHGTVAQADPLLLRDEGVLFGQLGASCEAKRCYAEMVSTDTFTHPLTYAHVQPEDYDGLLLPGGHAKGMRQALESEELRAKIARFWSLQRPVAAICHGVLALARTTPASGLVADAESDSHQGEGAVHSGAAGEMGAAQNDSGERSVLFARRTTTLPEFLEYAGDWLVFWKLGDYYRTYPGVTCAGEVQSFLENAEAQYVRGPLSFTPGTLLDDRNAHVVVDGNYVSARWPGDAYLFAKRFIALLLA
jgi:putative intracellular protease/amidase